MKKWTAITDGGKYGVQPTMEKPTCYSVYKMGHNHRLYQWAIDECVEYESHLLTLPRYLRTGGLEELEDGSEFEAILVKQFIWCGEWDECSDGAYLQTDDDRRREVPAPLVKDQDVASVHQDSIVPCVAPVDTCITDEQLAEILYLGFKSAQNAHRLYPENKHTFISHKEYLIGEAKKLLLLNSEQNVQECDARKADQGTEAGNQKSEPVEQEGGMEALKSFVSDQIMRLNNKDATDNIVAAIYRYKTMWQSLKQSDAVEFAEWLMDSNYSQSAINGKWYDYTVKDKDLVHYTTEELYKLFTLK